MIQIVITGVFIVVSLGILWVSGRHFPMKRAQKAYEEAMHYQDRPTAYVTVHDTLTSNTSEGFADLDYCVWTGTIELPDGTTALAREYVDDVSAHNHRQHRSRSEDYVPSPGKKMKVYYWPQKGALEAPYYTLGRNGFEEHPALISRYGFVFVDERIYDPESNRRYISVNNRIGMMVGIVALANVLFAFLHFLIR